MSYGLNSLKGAYIRDYMGDYYRAYQGDTRSLDYSSYEFLHFENSTLGQVSDVSMLESRWHSVINLGLRLRV